MITDDIERHRDEARQYLPPVDYYEDDAYTSDWLGRCIFWLVAFVGVVAGSELVTNIIELTCY